MDTMTAYLPPARAAAGTGARERAREASTAPRLFCFHHAGGAASTFGEWQRELGQDFRVLPVQLPGRERRAAEPRFTEMDGLVADLDRELDPLLADARAPYAFYGHSMGALVAYNLARRRAERGMSLPTRLMVGAHVPPHVTPPVGDMLALTDEQLAQWLVDIGGMSEVVRQYPAWVRAAVSLTRDDLRVCHSHRPAEGPPLPCAIEVFAGRDDPLLSLDAMAGWERHSGVGCQTHVIPGGHLFIHDSQAVFLKTVAALLSRGDDERGDRRDRDRP
jgi:surfactin synthase thioesterase subunit